MRICWPFASTFKFLRKKNQPLHSGGKFRLKQPNHQTIKGPQTCSGFNFSTDRIWEVRWFLLEKNKASQKNPSLALPNSKHQGSLANFSPEPRFYQSCMKCLECLGMAFDIWKGSNIYRNGPAFIQMNEQSRLRAILWWDLKSHQLLKRDFNEVSYKTTSTKPPEYILGLIIRGTYKHQQIHWLWN